MDITQYITNMLADSAQTLSRCLTDIELKDSIAKTAVLMLTAISNDKKIMLIGNGGSAADCQHFAAELVGRFKMDRDGLPAIALTTDTSILTSVANDYGYDQVFSRQVLSIGRPGDVLIAISTSGSSPSILNAVAAAKVSNITTVAFTGNRPSPLVSICDLAVKVPDDRTAHIQQVHLMLYHILCDIIENSLFAKNS